MCRRASRLIADSRCTKADLVRYYGIHPSRIDVVYLAADERFQPVTCDEELERVTSRYDLPEQYVLFVGSVEPRKNLPLLIRAMARVLREDSKHPLVIVGDPVPEHLKQLERLAVEEGLEPGRDLRFLGWVDDGDLPALYSRCELFVYPSRYEGFGLPPLEAMACGVPVLVPDNSSFAELYGESSLTLDLTGDDPVGSIAEAIQRMIGNNSLRSELVDRGFELARSRTWQDVALETLGIYQRAVS
jgi:glycosyltransferase involved in cell wall biosynthesis